MHISQSQVTATKSRSLQRTGNFLKKVKDFFKKANYISKIKRKLERKKIKEKTTIYVTKL